MVIRLSDHFTYSKLFRFTLPSIVMMIFTSIYVVVDGFFVSNFAGKTEFAAVNIIYPLIMCLGSIGFMFGTGGSALISKIMGQGDEEKANRIFSLIVYTSIVTSIVVAVIGFIFLESIAIKLGAEGEMLNHAVIYGRINMIALPAYILQYEFQSLFITAEKPHLGLQVTVLAGITNMVLDALLIAVIPMGVAGAAIATGLGQVVGGVLPLVYFSRPNDSRLRFTGTKFDMKALVKTCTNGSSELMTNISLSIVSMLYNIQLIKYAGENGVAAYGVLMYVNMIFIGTFLGYSVGVTPIIGYHYGAENHKELKSILRKSMTIILVVAIFMFVLAEVLARPLSMIFVSYDKELLDITLRGFLIYSFTFLFMGFSVFGSAFFTALNNGFISAFISFVRTLVLQVAAVLILPVFFKLDGIWAAVATAEFLAAIMTLCIIFAKRKFYHYD